MGITNSFRRCYGCWVGAFLLLVALLLTFSAGVHFESFEVRDQNGRTEAITMPYLAPGWGPGVYSLEGEVKLDWFAARRYQIVPDDRLLELKVNGQVVDLSEVPSHSLQDVSQGFHIGLEDYLHTGSNTVSFSFRDFGGEMGMAMKPSLGDWRYLLLWILWGGLVAGAFVAILRRFGVSRLHSFFYFVIIATSVVRAWYIFTYNPVNHIWSDPARHWEQGTDLLRIDLMSMTDPIGYQIYVAVLAKLSLKIPGLVAYFTTLLSLAGPWLWYRFFRELQSSKTLALAGWAFLSFLPSWVAIYGYFMQETLMLPLLGGALWATWRCRRKADTRTFVIMVFLWIATGLTRGIAVPLAAVACTWLWLAQDQKWTKALYSSLVLLLIMGPLTYRSYQIVGHFAPHGMGHLNVIYAQSGKKTIEITSRLRGAQWGHGFGSPSTGAEPFKPFSDWKTQRTGTVRINVDLAKGKEDWQREADKIHMSFSDYLWIAKENLIFLFFAESWPDNNLARAVDVGGSVIRFIWAPLLLVIAVGLIWQRKKFQGHWLLPAMLMAWFIVQGLIPIAINEGRYRKPFEGLAVAQVILLIAVIQGVARESAPVHTWWRNLVAAISRRRQVKNTVQES
jgi:hypothetical protein